jgi:hypothetical protein
MVVDDAEGRPHVLLKASEVGFQRPAGGADGVGEEVEGDGRGAAVGDGLAGGEVGAGVVMGCGGVGACRGGVAVVRGEGAGAGVGIAVEGVGHGFGRLMIYRLLTHHGIEYGL